MIGRHTKRERDTNMARKFALQYRYAPHRLVTYLPESRTPRCPAGTVGDATLFDTLKDALDAVDVLSKWDVGGSVVTIVGVEEIPGETKRELVPLEGKVDFDELSGFVERSLITGRFRGPYTMDPKRHLKDVTLYPTLSSWVGAVEYEVYGVRETTTEPTFRIISLEDALEAYDG